MKYNSKNYDYEGRFNSYYHQIKNIFDIMPENGSLLEIGPGSGFLNKYLQGADIILETLDITRETKPTYIGEITDIPSKDLNYDCVVAFEVLEHLPFDLFEKGIREMMRVSKKYVLFSVPDVRWYISMEFRAPTNSHGFRKVISLPRLRHRKIENTRGNDYHYWEIGRKGYPLKKILEVIERVDIKLIKHYRISYNPTHHIFVLCKD